MPYLKEGEEGEKEGRREGRKERRKEGEIELCLLLNDNFHNAIICKPEMILREIDLHNLLIRFYWTRIVDSWLLKDQNC